MRDANEITMMNKARDPMTISALTPSKMALNNRSGMNITTGILENIANTGSIEVPGNGVGVGGGVIVSGGASVVSPSVMIESPVVRKKYYKPEMV